MWATLTAAETERVKVPALARVSEQQSGHYSVPQKWELATGKALARQLERQSGGRLVSQKSGLATTRPSASKLGLDLASRRHRL